MAGETDSPVVLVTGAARGIGAATVRHVVARGATVFAVDIDDAVEGIAGDAGGQVATYIDDLADPLAPARMIDAAIDRFGRLDALHNNAGIFGDTEPAETYPLETFDKVLAINVRAVFLGMKAAIPHLRSAPRGRILNTASTGALIGSQGLIAYVGAKHAVLGMTRCVALELASDGIAVNALCPGATNTPMMSEYFTGRDQQGDEAMSAIAQITPTGRMADPDELGAVAAWALLDSPPYMTGAPLIVDGGQTARQ